MKVKATTFSYCPYTSVAVKSPHKPTNGATVSQRVTKAAEFVMLNFQDMWNAAEPGTSEYEAIDNEYASRFFMTGQLLANRDVIGFVGSLEYEYKSASIKFFNDSLRSDFTKISELDPYFVVTGMQAPSDINKDWLIVEEDLETRKEKLFSKSEKKRNKHLSSKSCFPFKERYAVYPFIYPGSLIRAAHIVLIIIDQKKKNIYYYDPQGLTSNDPCRMGLFEDNPSFDMHKNLMQLSEYLFKSEGEVTENITALQTDPVNCGVFVCRALERLYQGKSVHEALNYNSAKESISETRKRIGLTYMRTMQKKYPPTFKLNILPNYYEKPSEPLQDTKITSDAEGWTWD